MTIRGIAFPFQKGTSSFPLQKTEADVVEDNILRILQTRKGERPMRPGAGSSVYDFVFESVGAVLRARLEYEVKSSLAAGEPRANVLRVLVREQERADGARNVVVDLTWSFKKEVRQTAVAYAAPGSG